MPAGFTQWEDMIRGVIADMDAVLVDVQAAIDGLDEVDLTSQDIAIAIKARASTRTAGSSSRTSPVAALRSETRRTMPPVLRPGASSLRVRVSAPGG